jgi:two-component system sensor histidine kinase VicK
MNVDEAERAAIGVQGAMPRRVVMRRIGMRFWLAGAFAAVSAITAGAVYLFGDRPRAVLGAIALGTLAGFLIAVAISHRVARLSRAAGEMAAGSLDVPLQSGGRDEIDELARALESMRVSLQESFGVLTADRNKLKAIFDGLTDAVIVVDDGGPLRFSNSAAAALLDPAGAPPEAMLPLLRRATEIGFSAHPALRIGDRAYSLTARALPDERAVLAVLRDRTDEMRRELAEADFVSNAAHELRNPLAGISGAIEVLQSGAKDDPQARDHFLGRLADDAERMSRLTRSLLTLARVESLGAGETEVVDVAVAIRDVVEAVEAPPQVELSVELEPDLAVEGDPTLLRQVMIGLLTNAFKNTPPPGGVTVRGRRDDESEVVLEVIDTGTGIPAGEIDRVFERFYRRSESRKQEGFGLGLAIARRMVDVMGGRIGAASVEGKGSTFWVRLPIAKPSPTPVA